MIGEGSRGLLAGIVLCCAGGIAFASDVNWGKKVSCFVVDGTVVCPGCNYRAGLTCPRKLRDSQNCFLSITPAPKPTTKKYPPETSYEDDNVTESTSKFVNLTTPKTIEIQKEPTKSPVDMAIYLYRLLGSKSENRLKRELVQQQEQEEEEAEICNWNGDCPCPLICCKTGPGCPKRCVMGVRTPPFWG